MKFFEPKDVDDIVQCVVGRNRVIEEPNTGRQLIVDAQMPEEILKPSIAVFCKASRSRLVVAQSTISLDRV